METGSDGKQTRDQHLGLTATEHDLKLIEKARKEVGETRSTFMREAAVNRAISVLRHRSEEPISAVS